MDDNEFLRNVAEIIKAGLVQFFSDRCVVSSNDKHSLDADDQQKHPYIKVDDEHQRTLATITLKTEHALVIGHTTAAGTPAKEEHDYCHPDFPNTILHALGRLCKREERFKCIVEEAYDIADEDPEEALSYFLKECQQDPLLSKFISANFAVVLKMQMSSDRQSKARVQQWLKDWDLPTISELCT